MLANHELDVEIFKVVLGSAENSLDTNSNLGPHSKDALPTFKTEGLQMKTAVSNFKQHFFCLTNETKTARSVVDEILEELDLSDWLLLGNQVSLLIAADKVAACHTIAHQNIERVPVLERVVDCAAHLPFVTKLATPRKETVDYTLENQVAVHVLGQSQSE